MTTTGMMGMKEGFFSFIPCLSDDECFSKRMFFSLPIIFSYFLDHDARLFLLNLFEGGSVWALCRCYGLLLHETNFLFSCSPFFAS
jgi:hypothetical protein